MTHVLVMAKAPRPGRVKTRLCPPFTPAEAAELAAASLADSLDAVAASGADRRLLALDGPPGDWIPAGFEVFEQQGDGLAARLAHAWSVAGGPGLQIGMDTPQVTPALLDHCLDRLLEPGNDAALGLAPDGGWWAIGLVRSHPSVFPGVPMSHSTTGACQRRRLDDLGLTVADLPVLRDVDTVADVVAVADEVAGTRFAAAVRRLTSRVWA